MATGKGKFNTYRNLWLTMLLGGLRHGANWTFVLWGFYQGLILVIYRMLGVENAGAKSQGLVRALHVLWFFQLTCIGWLIFRAQNLDTIGIFLRSIFTDLRVTQPAMDALRISPTPGPPISKMRCARISNATPKS
ncbi:MAG: hypothetical protein FJ194_05020 [Gammaproteobacteria bacterium]|nr:hypothetical protein [Gammaproteobacteria bacterium]